MVVLGSHGIGMRLQMLSCKHCRYSSGFLCTAARGCLLVVHSLCHLCVLVPTYTVYCKHVNHADDCLLGSCQ